MAASMADLATAMDDALLVSVSFHQWRRRMEGEGGSAVREEVAGFVSVAEVRGRQWRWVRKGNMGGTRRGIRRVWFGFVPPHAMCTHVLVGR